MFSFHMIIQTTIVKAPISTFITRKTYCCTCSLSMWLFKTPLSMNPFPHLIHGNRPTAYVHSSYDYSIHTPLKVCSTSATTKFYTDINDDLRRRLLSDHNLDDYHYKSKLKQSWHTVNKHYANLSQGMSHLTHTTFVSFCSIVNTFHQLLLNIFSVCAHFPPPNHI